MNSEICLIVAVKVDLQKLVRTNTAYSARLDAR